MKLCLADLHVHTALSPCADSEMTPPAVVARALARGLHMIAVCDHNSAANVAAVQAAAERAPAGAAPADGERLTVLAGMEITTAEECHVVGLFPAAADAEAAGAEVLATLPEAEDGYEAFFGTQQLLDADGAEVARETRALAMATPFPVTTAVELVHRHGGLAVAAHIDRSVFGVIGQLGVFPADAGFDGVELSRHVAPGSAAEQEYAVHGLPILHSSDAHYLDDIGAVYTTLGCTRPGFAALASALHRDGAGSSDDA